MLTKVLLFALISSIHVLSHPAPSLVLCHGLQTSVRYSYEYRTSMYLNNADHDGKEPVSFGYAGKISVENIWQDERNYLLKVNFVNGETGNYFDRKGQVKRSPGYSSSGASSPLYVHVVDHVDAQEFKAFYRNYKEPVTLSNLKKGFASLLRTKKSPEQNDSVKWVKKGQEVEQTFTSSHEGETEKPLMLPHISDEWSITSKVGRDHTLIVESNGWQNVTFTSKIYQEAFSKLYLTYSLKLLSEEKVSPDQLSKEKGIDKIISSLGDDYIEDELVYQKELKTCENCKTLQSMKKEYTEHMSDDEMASVPAAIAYLRLLDRIRSGGPGASSEDIQNLLKNLNSNSHAQSSLLDILAGARTDQAVHAALVFLDLPNNNNLDITERFLAVLSASCLTAAHNPSDTYYSSLEFIVKELLNSVKIDSWESYKLKLSTFSALATTIRAYNTLSSVDDFFSNSVNLDLIKLIQKEIINNDDPESVASLLVALGNAANLKHSYDLIQPYAFDTKNGRESIFALRAIQDSFKFLSAKCQRLIKITSLTKDESECISKLIGESLYLRIKKEISQIVWDERHESTSRIIATEIIAEYFQDDILVNSILRDVEKFGNFEMTTLMWNRALRERRSVENTHKNWLIHSKLFNGSSASFRKQLAGTSNMNAYYGISMELLTRGKLLKESSFDFDLHANRSKPLHVVSVGLLARGLGSIAGDDSDSDETTSAGLALKVLDVRLRPYTLFMGKSDLMGHVWSGTASEPVTVFSGNLLVADYDDDGHHLINGFLLEQKMHGVLSLKLTAKISISLWGRNSHSVVNGKAALLIQGSQTIRTSDRTTMISQRFSYGGSTSLDVITDADFYTMPFKHCLQMEQPELTVRHNTRKYEQVDTPKAEARIHRRSYFIPAKSFEFHDENNKMCALMKT